MSYSKKAVKFFLLAILLSGFVLFLSRNTVLACSRVLSANNGQAVLCGRNMDWPENMATSLWIFPRDIKRSGLVKNNSLTWASKYGSLVNVSSAKDLGLVSDGMNEKGLAANLLWLDESDYGIRDTRLPGLSVSLWAQYYLDSFATVAEAVQAFKKSPYQIITLSVPQGKISKIAALHLSLADKTGDSAIIEFIGGKAVIHHDRNYAVMTNSPAYEKQLGNLKQYDGFGGSKPLPGTTKPQDRFVRAAYYLKYLPKPHDLREALAGVFSIMRNISQPFHIAFDPKHPSSSATIWRVVADLTNGTYYFESTVNPNIVWADLNKFDLKSGSSAMRIDLSANSELVGNITKQFVKAKPFEFISNETTLR
ncbi:MAG: linear amide C-N hydrolase [Candidatus Saganbacteria bacterium]|nr:linear amide C-N hydrolase [Candidatus Saganbacteria bacterium]